MVIIECYCTKVINETINRSWFMQHEWFMAGSATIWLIFRPFPTAGLSVSWSMTSLSPAVHMIRSRQLARDVLLSTTTAHNTRVPFLERNGRWGHERPVVLLFFLSNTAGRRLFCAENRECHETKRFQCKLWEFPAKFYQYKCLFFICEK